MTSKYRVLGNDDVVLIVKEIEYQLRGFVVLGGGVERSNPPLSVRMVAEGIKGKLPKQTLLEMIGSPERLKVFFSSLVDVCDEVIADRAGKKKPRRVHKKKGGGE